MSLNNKSLSEQLSNELNALLKTKLNAPVAEIINAKLEKYLNELISNGEEPFQALFKVIQKSNLLMIEQTTAITNVFLRFDDESKIQMIKQLKELKITL